MSKFCQYLPTLNPNQNVYLSSISHVGQTLDKFLSNVWPRFVLHSALAVKLIACLIFVKILSVSKVCPNLVKQNFFLICKIWVNVQSLSKTLVFRRPQIEIQGSAKLSFRSCENFVSVVAYHFCLSKVVTFSSFLPAQNREVLVDRVQRNCKGQD